jgi:hypothetical protein
MIVFLFTDFFDDELLTFYESRHGVESLEDSSDEVDCVEKNEYECECDDDNFSVDTDGLYDDEDSDEDN